MQSKRMLETSSPQQTRVGGRADGSHPTRVNLDTEGLAPDFLFSSHGAPPGFYPPEDPPWRLVRQSGAREGSRLLRQWIDCLRCGGGIAPPLEARGPGSCTQGRWCPLRLAKPSSRTSLLARTCGHGRVPASHRRWSAVFIPHRPPTGLAAVLVCGNAERSRRGSHRSIDQDA